MFITGTDWALALYETSDEQDIVPVFEILGGYIKRQECLEWVKRQCTEIQGPPPFHHQLNRTTFYLSDAQTALFLLRFKEND